jgi:hypothetical protein
MLTHSIQHVREYVCSVVELACMNSAFSLDPESRIAEVLLNNALPLLDIEHRNIAQREGDSISELLDQNLTILDKLEDLKIKQCQLKKQKKYTVEYYRNSIELTNLLIEILQENWNDLPIPAKRKLQEKLNVFRFKFSPKLFIQGIKLLVFVPLNTVRALPYALSNQDKYLELFEDYKEVLSKLKSLSLEIEKYGHPILFRDFEVQLQKNQAALKLLDSIKDEVLTEKQRLQREQEFEALKKEIDFHRSPGKGAFS